MTLTGFSMNTSDLAENENNSFTLDAFKALAKKHSVNIISGIMLYHRKKVTNNAILVNAKGEIKLRYKKIQLFSFVSENNLFSPGNTLPLFKLKTLSLGLTVCYDLRFPELYRYLGRNCNLIINIANWPKIRINHWYILLKARAIENQLFIAGVNRSGVDGNRIKYVNSSRIICLDGSTLKHIFKSLSFYDININLCNDYRKFFSTINIEKPNNTEFIKLNI